MCECDRYIQQRLTVKQQSVWTVWGEGSVLVRPEMCVLVCLSVRSSGIYKKFSAICVWMSMSVFYACTRWRGGSRLPALTHDTHTHWGSDHFWLLSIQVGGGERERRSERNTNTHTYTYFVVTGSWDDGLCNKVGFGLKCRPINWAVMVP